MTGRLSFGYFSLAKQRKVTDVLSPDVKLALSLKTHHTILRTLTNCSLNLTFS